MNYYLLFLSLYSLCIFPAVLSMELRLGKGFAYRFRIGVPGFGLGKKGPEKEREEEGSLQNLEDLPINATLVKTLLSRKLWRDVSHMVSHGRIWLWLHIAFPDAAATALGYAAASTMLHVFRHLRPGHFEFRAKEELSFDGKGSQLALRGIFTLRLGSIALMAARIAAAYHQQKARGKAKDRLRVKEEQYAASHR